MESTSQPGIDKDRALRLQKFWKADGMRVTDSSPALLSASILCADPLRIKEDLRQLEEGGIDLLHIDAMDGVFVPRLGLRPELVSALREATELPIDVHLMVCNPENHIPVFADAGADIIIVHAEAPAHLPMHLSLIRKCGARAGVALNPATIPDVITYLDEIDIVLLMMFNPGGYGGRLMPGVMRKISDVRSQLGEKSKHVHIMIDGNVNLDKAPEMIGSGATILVCGTSSIFNQKGMNLSEGLRFFRSELGKKA